MTQIVVNNSPHHGKPMEIWNSFGTKLHSIENIEPAICRGYLLYPWWRRWREGRVGNFVFTSWLIGTFYFSEQLQISNPVKILTEAFQLFPKARQGTSLTIWPVLVAIWKASSTFMIMEGGLGRCHGNTLIPILRIMMNRCVMYSYFN